MTKRSRPSTVTSLNCKDHQFFEGILEIPEEQKAFYDRVVATEVEVFKGFLLTGLLDEAYAWRDLSKRAKA